MPARAWNALGDRYAIHEEIAAGGMATVHLGRRRGDAGFSRAVAIKRLHPEFAHDEDFVAMLLDEARLAARIRHMHVVPVVDVVAKDGELFLVMEYVHGKSLSKLLAGEETRKAVTPSIAVGVVSQLLLGLHGAHETRDDRGEPLGIVHRDVSPHNVIIGVDGVARVLDFGIAKAVGRFQNTRNGAVKGKLGYMAPEQLRGGDITRQADVYSASVVLWELLAKRRLFEPGADAVTIDSILFGLIEPPSAHSPEVSPALDALVMRGLSRERFDRFPTALAMATALCAASPPADSPRIAAWVDDSDSDGWLDTRRKRIAEIESDAAAAAVFEKPAADPREAPTLIEAPPPPRRRWALAVKTLPIGIAMIVAVSALRGTARHAPAATASAPSAEAPLTSLDPLDSPGEVATAVPPLSPATTQAATLPAHARSHAAHVPHPSTAITPRDCDPPFTRDEEGRKIWKRECLNP